jgi:carbon storage regulator CsrA
MLVLSRRAREGVVVKHAGEEVTIRVWVDGHQIKVGVDGPRSFEVRREELVKERQHVDTR